MTLKATLSLCMIVRNEAETLERCLLPAREFVDEIVIVDTGSTDGTQDIARKYADVYKETVWPNSFAIARNISMDLASGTHILILDGDEYIPDPDHWRAIREGIERRDVVALQLFVRNLLPENQIVAADSLWQERILRNHRMLRYEGRVHNQITPSIRRFIRTYGGRIEKVEAEVIHTGYRLDREHARKKYTPRIQLLQREIEEAEDEVHRAYYQFQLAVVYYMFGEFEKVLGIFQQTDFEQLIPFNRFYAHTLAAHAALKTKQLSHALHHANQMMEVSPEEPIGYYTAAHALFAVGEASTAVQMLRMAFEKNEHPHVRFPLNEGVLLKEIALICMQANLPRYALFFAQQCVKYGVQDEAILQLIDQLEKSHVVEH